MCIRDSFNVDVSDNFWSAVKVSGFDRFRFDMIFLLGVEIGVGDLTLKLYKFKKRGLSMMDTEPGTDREYGRTDSTRSQ